MLASRSPCLASSSAASSRVVGKSLRRAFQPALLRQCRRNTALDAALRDTQLVPVQQQGELTQYPAQPGVYAVFDEEAKLQYIGLSRKISASVGNHLTEQPALTKGIKYELVEDASREALTAAWKAWVEEYVGDNDGAIPPGNMPGETRWQSRKAKAKAEVRLTAGKPISVPIEELIEQVVKTNKVVAFVKGQRTAPACGFSHKLMTMLNEMRVDYEVVNVLDEVSNPGLRDALKTYSQWPTIPQLYINGEFVGGADIVEQLVASGELATMVKAA